MSALATLKRLLIGKPIATKHAHQERLIVPFGLAVFASDALSSVAYASEEIMLVLVLAGPSALHYLFSTSLWLAGLMVIVGFSYFQTIFAYPKGGGTYLVSSQNLGSRAGQTAGAALLIDYVLTVSVSISSGVAAIVSMSPGAHAYTVPIALTGILVLTFANLRGAKESGAMFAIPTYIFVVLVLTVVVMSLIHGIGHAPHDAQIVPPAAGFQVLTAFLMLRAFAASCTALTGTEAIADGVQAFRPPEARNASLTLALMIGLLLTMFLGISWSAMHYGIVPMDASHPHYRTVLAQLASIQFGRGALFYLIQIATALILFLAANTAYADFPRLSSFLARDGFLPRQLMSVGDRLVYQNGIVLLGITSAALIFVFNADTHSLIPLYALGVFVSFTMSQTGMGVKFFRDRKRVIDRSARFAKRTSDAIILGLKSGVSFIGAATTFIVLLILLVTKFEEGAWLIVVAMTMVLFGFGAVRKHYDWLAKKLAVRETDAVQDTSAICSSFRACTGES